MLSFLPTSTVLTILLYKHKYLHKDELKSMWNGSRNRTLLLKITLYNGTPMILSLLVLMKVIIVHFLKLRIVVENL